MPSLTSFEKNSSELKISKNRKMLKALKKTVRCVCGPSHGNEQSFSFTVDQNMVKRKQNGKLF